MLPDLEPGPDGQIVAGNIRAVQAIYFARQLEDMRAFQVVDRLAQLFQQGLLPLGRGTGAKLLKQYVKSGARLSAQERSELYFRALGVRPGSAKVAEPNREFHLACTLVSKHFFGAGLQGVESTPHDQLRARLRQIDAACQVGVDEAHVHARHVGAPWARSS